MNFCFPSPFFVRSLKSIDSETCFSAQDVVAMLKRNWFMLLAVRTSSFECAREVIQSKRVA